jgi:hypothetical protein
MLFLRSTTPSRQRSFLVTFFHGATECFCPGSHRQKAAQGECEPLYLLQILSLSLFEKTPLLKIISQIKPEEKEADFSNQLKLFQERRDTTDGLCLQSHLTFPPTLVHSR